jgi:putative tryptophan/tyrosine transport system substrate-binding protein
MRRREFILVFGGVVTWPLAARGQQSGKIWRAGFIAHRYESFYDGLFEGLHELGYVEGHNIIFERRYAEGRAERFQDFAAEMVRLKVDIVIVVTTPAALAVKNATTTIPIVHPNAIDPVESGLVASLAHPGGNVTGLAVANAELSAKRVEILKQLLPRLARAAVLWNVANPGNAVAWKDTEHAARVLGVEMKSYELRESKDIESLFAIIARERPDGLLVLQDALTLAHRKQIIDFTLRERIPAMFVGKEWAEEGGLVSYGDLLPERYRLAASIVDKILKGAKPADIPVSQPIKFELVINLKTAKALGLEMPGTLLATADEVIE